MGCCKSCDEGRTCEGDRPAPSPDAQGCGCSSAHADFEPSLSPDLPHFARLGAGSLRPVATRLVLAHAVATASEPVELECTTGSVDLVIFKLAQITSVEVFVEAATDGQNYRRICATVLKSEGAARVRFRNTLWKFLRLYYVATGSQGGVGLLAATLSGSRN